VHTLVGLWLPILVSSALVFIASSLVWNVLGAHKWHIRGLPDEAAASEALAKQNVAPGMYTIPYSSNPAAIKDKAFQEKLAIGPVAVITVRKPGLPNMASFLGSWFLYLLLVSYAVALACGQALYAGAPQLLVFKLASLVAFAGYSFAQIPNAIWWGRPWKSALKECADGLVYALLTGAAFAWLWPSASA
jgi:hypothetical protein